ncbi:MAG TPA: FliI/YscN family ATPase [Kofleriaceae bacterium]
MNLSKITAATKLWAQPTVLGRVTEVAGTLIQISVPEEGAPVLGDVLEVETTEGPIPCEVVGFRGATLLTIPLKPARNINVGSPARPTGRAAMVSVGDALLGRVIDPFGLPMDGGDAPRCTDRVPLDAGALPINQRGGVNTRFDTGVRVIDGMLTCGRGQRIGIFAGAGCGKSVLVEQIASQGEADVIVIGLIGERGREVVELMGSHRRAKMIIVAATADRSPLERLRGATAATAIAEYFRDRGKNVMLVIDSLTRFAMATREIGLALGEPPATKGYPPSVFANMPRLLERVAPRAGSGSITAFYTVLVEGDDLSDPIADSARSLLDAHIVLSRDMAGRGHFPAVDILSSASRVARRVAGAATVALASRAREVLALRKQAQELQALGAYQAGQNKELDAALVAGIRIDAWSRQAPEEASTHELALAGLHQAIGN